MKFSRIREPHVVRTPFVQQMSFRAMGMPVSAPISPFRIRSSAACRLGQGRFPHQADVRMDILFHRVDPAEDGGGNLRGGRLARPEPVQQFVNGQLYNSMSFRSY